MYSIYIILISASIALAQKKGDSNYLPANGHSNDMGGIFGISASMPKSSVSPSVLGGLIATGSESPKLGKAGRAVVGGTGPYKAAYNADPSLPNHTIYAPKRPPTGVKMPVLIFGNGLCLNMGTMYPNFLTEIASHGYLVIANGPPKGGSGFAKSIQMTESIDWVTKNASAGKYGAIDAEKIAASGQSCGGLEAYSASKQPPNP
jgi:hypothetical protein